MDRDINEGITAKEFATIIFVAVVFVSLLALFASVISYF
jgi:hypothetical protein